MTTPPTPIDAMVEALKAEKADYLDQIWCLLQRAKKAEEFVDGLLGLCQLIAGRDDVTDELRHVLKTNHRVEDARKFRRERHPILTEVRPPISDKMVRAEIMRLMREDFDPTPPNWEGRDWNDNAEDVADSIVSLFGAAALQHQEPGGTVGSRMRAKIDYDGITAGSEYVVNSVQENRFGKYFKVINDNDEVASLTETMFEPATPPAPPALDRAVEALEKAMDRADGSLSMHDIIYLMRRDIREALSAIRGNGGRT